MLTGSTKRLRAALIAGLMAGATSLTGCSEVAAHSTLHNFKIQAKQVRNEVKVMRPGELGPMLDGLDDEKLRYVAYRSIESQRERLRAGRDQWASLDTFALLETAKMDMNADYQPLRGVAKAHYVWASLESMEPGQVARMMDGPHADAVVGWVADFQDKDVPSWRDDWTGTTSQHCRSTRWSGFPRRARCFGSPLSRTRDRVRCRLPQQGLEREAVTEIMRLWCSAEGWSRLLTVVI